MCAYENEMLTFQLFLYARRRQSSLEYDRNRLLQVLSEWRITTMRQLFDLPAEARTALVLPLLSRPVEVGDKVIYRVEEEPLAA